MQVRMFLCFKEADVTEQLLLLQSASCSWRYLMVVVCLIFSAFNTALFLLLRHASYLSCLYDTSPSQLNSSRVSHLISFLTCTAFARDFRIGFRSFRRVHPPTTLVNEIGIHATSAPLSQGGNL